MCHHRPKNQLMNKVPVPLLAPILPHKPADEVDPPQGMKALDAEIGSFPSEEIGRTIKDGLLTMKPVKRSLIHTSMMMAFKELKNKKIR